MRLTIANSVLASCLFLGATAQKELNKPLVIQPPQGLHEFFDDRLTANLPTRASTSDAWGYGYLPARCHDIPLQEKPNPLSPYDIEVFNVKYDDCGTTWVMCRHKNAQVSQAQMREMFGRLPVHTRQWIRTVLALPGGRSGAAFTDLGDIILRGDVQNSLSVWVHESGHVLDRNGVAGVPSGTDFSATSRWRNEYNLDSHNIDDYSLTNHVENFAQEVVVAMYDKVVPGGASTAIGGDWQKVFHQYATAQAALGGNIVPGGTCDRRWAFDRIVCMGPDAPCDLRQAKGSSVDIVSLEFTGNVTVDKNVPLVAAPVGRDEVVACDHEH